MSSDWTRPLSTGEVISQILGGCIGLACALLFFFLHKSGSHLIEFVLLFWIPALVLHELAHAGIAQVLGGRVFCIKLGPTPRPTGKCLRFRLGFRWEIYSVPFSGSAFVYFITASHYRRNIISTFAAGPIASFSAALTGGIPLLLGAEEPFATPLTAWFLINTYFFLLTVTPMTGKRKDHVWQTDALRVWGFFRMTDAHLKEHQVQQRLAFDLLEEKASSLRLSIDEAISRYQNDPDDLAALLFLIDKLNTTGDLRTNDYIAELIFHPNSNPRNYVNFLDNYLTDHLIKGTVKSDPRYDQFSERLLTASGQTVTTKGTRGSILIDLGRIEEGRAMLQEVLKKTTAPIDMSFANIFLALAAKEEGDLTTAHEFAANATRFGKDAPALKRVADLLEPAS